jgi:hypothetical protein
MIERIRMSSLASSTELTAGAVVLGGVLAAARIGFPCGFCRTFGAAPSYVVAFPMRSCSSRDAMSSPIH